MNQTPTPAETPRTDAIAWKEDQHSEWCDADFARTLERELATAQAELTTLREKLAEARTLAMDGHNFQMQLCEVFGIKVTDVSLPHQELIIRAIAELRAENVRLTEGYGSACLRITDLEQELTKLNPAPL